MAKSAREYDEADAIADELFDLGVDLDDKARTWTFVYSKGADSGPDGGGGHIGGGSSGSRGGGYRTPTNHDYQRDASDDYSLTQAERDRIDELLGRRLAAKRAHDFERADAMQTELREIGVEVDDKARVWYVRYHGGGRAASSFNVRGW